MSISTTTLFAVRKTLTIISPESSSPLFLNCIQSPSSRSFLPSRQFRSHCTRRPTCFPRSRRNSAISSARGHVDSSGLVVEKTDKKATQGWEEFAKNVSGEWDGFGANFSHEGRPIELPEAVVPEAFREWEVKIFDWQTQCPTLAEVEEVCALSYSLIKLLPTVGCEADAATRHTVDKKYVGTSNSNVLAFAYHLSGCYVAVWPIDGVKNVYKKGDFFEVEHCLVDPENRESRVRVLQKIQMVETDPEQKKIPILQGITVFSELWYGPFRNGEQLGGCALREAGFASTEAVKNSQILGTWNTRNFVANFGSSQPEGFKEFVGEMPITVTRDGSGLVLLPKNLWCSLREIEDGGGYVEVGWILNNGSAITSRCTFRSDGTLLEARLGYEHQ